MKRIIMITLTLLAACSAAAYAAEEPYFGYELDGNTLTVMENYEFDKTDYQEKLFVLVYDGDKLIKVCPEQPGDVANEHVATIPDGIGNMKIKAAYVNDNGGIEIEAVPHYVAAVVDYTVTTKDDVTIYFKEVTDDMPLRMSWKTDGSSDINITIGGNVIDYTELYEDDVLSIACDPECDTLDNKPYYDIKVSRNVIDDTLTGTDAKKNIIVMPQWSFKAAISEDDFQLLDVGTEYNMNLDVFGRVAYHMGMIGSYGNSGNIIGMYESENAEQPIVRMLDVTYEKARILEFECKSAAQADEFYNIATGTKDGYKGELTTEALYERIKSGKTFCRYKLSGGKIKIDIEEAPVGGEDLVFNKEKGFLGKYHIEPEVTLIIDITDFLDGKSDFETVDYDRLEDGKNYSVCLYNKNLDSVYRYMLITGE